MRAVNLVPGDARRGRGVGGASVSVSAFGPAQFVVLLLVVVVVLVLLRVLADNDVNNKKATLAAVQSQVSTEQAEASRLSVYVTFVKNAEQRETEVTQIADQRFPWKRTLDQISHVLPASTSVSSLQATIAGTATLDGATVTAPTFTISGCAHTPNQNGTATVLRRLTQVTGVTNVGFEDSSREPGCGNQFGVVLSFGNFGAASTSSGTSAAPTTTTTGSATTTTGTTTTTTTTTGTTG